MWVFHSVRTAGNGDIQHSTVALTSPDAPSAMELIQLNITERKHGIAWRIRKQIEWLPKMVSHVLTSSNA